MKNSPKQIEPQSEAILEPKARLCVLLARAGGLVLALAASEVMAQQTVVIGSNAAPGVTVNEDVLRSLDEPQGTPLPRLQLPGAAPTDQIIRLRPPPGVLNREAGGLTLRAPRGEPTPRFRLHLPTGRYIPVAPPLTAPSKPRRQLAAPTREAPATMAPKVARKSPPAEKPKPAAKVLSRSVAPELIVVPPSPKVAAPTAPVPPKAPAPSTTTSKMAPPAVPKAPQTLQAPKIAKVAPPPLPARTAPKPLQREKVVAPPAPAIPTPPAAAPKPPQAPKIQTKAAPKPKPVPVPPPVQARKQEPETAQTTQPQKQPQKQAALTPAPAISSPPGYGTLISLKFAEGASALTAGDKTQLADLADRLTGSTDRLQLKAYASAEGGTASAARRLSLSRALTVRSQLIAKGIRSTRIDVRALGIADSGEPDRVDVLLLKRP